MSMRRGAALLAGRTQAIGELIHGSPAAIEEYVVRACGRFPPRAARWGVYDYVRIGCAREQGG